LGVCGYGIADLTQKFDPSLFFLEGSYIREHFITEQLYFPKRFLPVQVFSGGLAYETEDVQRKLLRLCDEDAGVVARSSYILPHSTNCWYSQMHDSFNLSSLQSFSADDFYPKLRLFLAGEGARFERDLSFHSNSRDKLRASRFDLRLVHLESNDEQVTAMQDLQDVVSSVQLEATFPFARPFTFFAQFAVLKKELFQSLGGSLAVVFLVTLIMIGNPLVCLIVFSGVAMTVVDILGLMHYWDVNLNSVAMITLSVSVGLSVDFSAHIGLEFMEGLGERKERVREALENLGPSLVHGGISTFLVISLLVIARSYVFRIFFKMFFLTLGLGMYHGIVVVPVLLSFAGPNGFYGTADQKRDANVRITTISPVFGKKQGPGKGSQEV